MIARTPERSAADFLPSLRTVNSLHRAEQVCRGCELYERATQVVSGEGPSKASLMIVGEVPGDAEDKAGHPFVGPSGSLLNACLKAAGIDRKEVFVTNAVKHFNWTQSGKKRLHKKPIARQIKACHPWLEAEISVVQPTLIVCLGATAAQSLLGSQFKITQHRGEIVDSTFGAVLATYHPSAILRAPDQDSRHKMQEEMIADLKVAQKQPKKTHH